MLPERDARARPRPRRGQVPVLVAGEAEPQALDLGGDDRDHRRPRRRPARCRWSAASACSPTSAPRPSARARPCPSAEVQVVAAAGTPAGDARRGGGGDRHVRGAPSAPCATSLGERYGGAQSVAYALTALACALVALLALGAGVARHLRDYRRDVASLRVLGISTGTARRAGRAELVSLTAAGPRHRRRRRLARGRAAPRRAPAAGRTRSPALPLDTAPHLWPLVVPAVVAGGRRRARRWPGPRRPRAATTRPSLLREEEGPMIQLLGAILRGLRSRALLSAGSVLLTALAIGSAVLGPVFSEAVTNSYVVTRLQETPAGAHRPEPGLHPRLRGRARAGRARRRRGVRRRSTSGPWQEPVVTVESERFSALRGVVTFWSRDDACEHLRDRGSLPGEATGEVLMLAADVETTGAEIGEPLALPIFEPGGRAAARPAAPGARPRSSSSAPTTPPARTTTG